MLGPCLALNNEEYRHYCCCYLELAGHRLRSTWMLATACCATTQRPAVSVHCQPTTMKQKRSEPNTLTGLQARRVLQVMAAVSETALARIWALASPSPVYKPC